MSQELSQPAASSQPRLNIYGYNCLGKHLGMVLTGAIPLFIAAGSLNWVWAWFFTLVSFMGWLVLSLVLVRVNPELLNERGKRFKELGGTKTWDWLIMVAYSILLILCPIVAGLDYRYGWNLNLGDGIKLTGIVVFALSFIPLIWSMAVNRFFEATVRIQTNRGHRVVTSGPYQFVRHPGYVGVILQFIALPLSLGSYTAWIPTFLAVFLYIIRTELEDRTLQAELPGYKDYAEHVRYRLIPGLW